MRNTLLHLFIPISFAFAQQPYGKNADWFLTFNGNHMGYGAGYGHVYHHKDSIIDGLEYQWMQHFLVTIIRTGPNPEDLDYLSNGIANNFFYRTENNKVYYYSFDFSDSYLLFDFDAQIGDTVFFRDTLVYVDDSCTHLPGYVVTDRGTEMIDGKPMEYWDIDSIFWGGQFLEGNRIYRDMGVLHTAGTTSFRSCHTLFHEWNFYTIRCFTNDSTHYQNPSWNRDCDYFSALSVEALDSKPTWSVYPNPTNQTLNISGFPEGRKMSVSVLDLQGKMVGEYAVSNSETQSLNFGNLPVGMYLVRIVDETGRVVYVEKVVKQ